MLYSTWRCVLQEVLPVGQEPLLCVQQELASGHVKRESVFCGEAREEGGRGHVEKRASCSRES